MASKKYPRLNSAGNAEVSLNYWPYFPKSPIHQHNATYEYYKVFKINKRKYFLFNLSKAQCINGF